MKAVTFNNNVVEQKITFKCYCCSYRNISPHNREIVMCLICKMKICRHCMVEYLYSYGNCRYGICIDCESDCESDCE